MTWNRSRFDLIGSARPAIPVDRAYSVRLVSAGRNMLQLELSTPAGQIRYVEGGRDQTCRQTSRECAAMSVLNDPKLEALIDALQARSKAQEAAERALFPGPGRGPRAAPRLVLMSRRRPRVLRPTSWWRWTRQGRVLLPALPGGGRGAWSRSARRFGVSTLYLAAAVRDNFTASGGDGVVIGTEHEPAKAARRARQLRGGRALPTSSSCAKATCARP